MIEVISFAAIGSTWVAIFVVYSWTSRVNKEVEARIMKEVKDIAEIVRDHHEDKDLHGKTDGLVTAELCGERVKRIEEGQKNLATNMEAGFQRLESVIKQKNISS